MFAPQFMLFWPAVSCDETEQTPPKPRRVPVFIGDAVQPWGSETMLLDILRRDGFRGD